MIEIISPMIKQFLPFAQKRMGFDAPPKLFLRGDDKNAQNPLGKTAYYDPGQKSITVYITGRHPKDVMRSISHELVHHAQNCRGEFDKPHQMGDGYAQNDKHMREMERQAYEIGNMCFRDWEDGLKNTIYLEHLQKGEKKMSTKDWKNKEIGQLLSEAWGFKFNSLEEFNEFNGEGELQAEAEEEIDEGRGKKKKMEEADDDLDEGRGKKKKMEEAEEELEETYYPGYDTDEEQRKIDRKVGRLGRRADGTPINPGDPEDPNVRANQAKKTQTNEEEELEERARGRRHQKAHDPARDDDRTRPMEEKEDKDKKEKKGKKDKLDVTGKGGKGGPDGEVTRSDIITLAKKNKKPTKEQIEALVKKALQEALQKRKG